MHTSSSWDVYSKTVVYKIKDKVSTSSQDGRVYHLSIHIHYSIIHHPSSVIHHPSSIIHHPSSIYPSIHPSIIYHISSSIKHQYHQSSISSIIHLFIHPSYIIYHQASSINIINIINLQFHPSIIKIINNQYHQDHELSISSKKKKKINPQAFGYRMRGRGPMHMWSAMKCSQACRTLLSLIATRN